MRGSLKIARIAGIDIGIHYSWILAFLIIGSTLAIGNFVDLRPQWLRLGGRFFRSHSAIYLGVASRDGTFAGSAETRLAGHGNYAFHFRWS